MGLVMCNISPWGITILGLSIIMPLMSSSVRWLSSTASSIFETFPHYDTSWYVFKWLIMNFFSTKTTFLCLYHRSLFDRDGTLFFVFSLRIFASKLENCSNESGHLPICKHNAVPIHRDLFYPTGRLICIYLPTSLSRTNRTFTKMILWLSVLCDPILIKKRPRCWSLKVPNYPLIYHYIDVVAGIWVVAVVLWNEKVHFYLLWSACYLHPFCCLFQSQNCMERDSVLRACVTMPQRWMRWRRG